MTQPTLTFINLITGPLGSGKTTLVRHLLTLKPKNENWVLLVNEFGSVGIDGAILGQDATVQSVQLPGGCICCTAQNEFEKAIHDILNTHQPDRILIEPTGLGEPDSLTDILQAPSFNNLIQLQTVFAVFDSSSVSLQDIHTYTIIQNLLTMADIVLLNKHDLASNEQIQSLQDYCDSLFPAKQAVLTCQQGKIASHWLDLEHTQRANSAGQPSSHQALDNLMPKHPQHGVMLPFVPVIFEQPVERHYKNELGMQSLGYIFKNDVTFDWNKLQSLFQSFNLDDKLSGVKRAKAVLKVGAPWMLFQWVNQQTTREFISYRRDSRLEFLIEAGADFDFHTFESHLKTCVL